MLRLVRTATLAGLTLGLIGATVTNAGAEAGRDQQPGHWAIYPGPHGELFGAEIGGGTIAPRSPSSDQIRGPVHDGLTGAVRPGNPSPSVR